MEFFFPALFIAGVIVVVISAVRQHNRRTNEVLRDAARRLGLTVTRTRGGFHRLEGKIGPCDVSVKVRSGQNNQRETKYEIGYPDLGVAFRFTAANRMTRLLPTAVTGDVEIGDTLFDDAVIVKAPDPAAVAAYMNVQRREAVLVALRNHGGLTVSSDELDWTVRGAPGTAEDVVAAVGRLMGLLATLGVTGIAPGVTRPVSAPSALVQRAHPQVPATAGDPFDVPRKPAGLPQPLTGPAPKPVVSPPPSKPPPIVRPDDLVSRVGGYMTGMLPSHEVERRFVESDKGHRVRGSGVVGRTHRFAFDLDFGNGPAVKAMVDVEMPGSASPLRVALRLPEDTDLERGSPVSFEGDLAKVTPIVRSVFLDNVTLG
ncbi:MAG: hypothetical protein OEO77_01400 [Acidimicrobiia bacterium]|nr:hypothetical protein [Acidimicrobiia bacterium]